MKLFLDGHDYKFAVEQIMLAMFPEERPDYDCGNLAAHSGTTVCSRLVFGAKYAQVMTLISREGRHVRGIARVSKSKLTDELTRARLLQRIVKQSFFRAGVRFLDSPPVWGSLTGIRPAKLAASILETGVTKKNVALTLSREFYVSRERSLMCADAAQVSIDVKNSLEQSDIMLYAGIPFCPTRCAYCSFVSNSVEKSFGLIEHFTNTMLHEMSAAAEIVRKYGLRVVGVYIGGGTPTALPAEVLERIMLALKTEFDFSHVREYTVEAGRPDTISQQKIDIIRRLGADRICVNPQSMSAEVLAAIGRKHTPEDVLRAEKLVRQSGASLNMDIIAGLPGDRLRGFCATLDTLLGLGPESITVHTLSLKKGSRLMQGVMEIPSGTEVSQMLGYACRQLRQSGYSPYYMYRQKFTSGGFENTGWSLAGY